MKKYWFIAVFVCFLASCAANNKGNRADTAQQQVDYSGQEVIFVYDAADTLRFTFTDTKHLEQLGMLIGEGTAQTGSENPAALFTEMPADAQVLYRYVLQNKRGNRVELLVYTNYRSVQMHGIPVLGTITWNIPESDYNTLCRPDTW